MFPKLTIATPFTFRGWLMGRFGRFRGLVSARSPMPSTERIPRDRRRRYSSSRRDTRAPSLSGPVPAAPPIGVDYEAILHDRSRLALVSVAADQDGTTLER